MLVSLIMQLYWTESGIVPDSVLLFTHNSSVIVIIDLISILSIKCSVDVNFCLKHIFDFW
jgi:hypothetical protein